MEAVGFVGGVVGGVVEVRRRRLGNRLLIVNEDGFDGFAVVGAARVLHVFCELWPLVRGLCLLGVIGACYVYILHRV